MFYYKTKRAKKFKQIDVKDKEEAIKILKSIGIKIDNLQILSEEELVEVDKIQKPKSPSIEEVYNNLNERCKKILSYVYNIDSVKDSMLTLDLLKEIGINNENSNLPYYVYCYWYYGEAGAFANEEDVKETVETSVLAREDWFDYTIYDINLNEIEVNIEINVSLIK